MLEILNDFNSDLILMDYRLADTNGGNRCRTLKSNPEHHHIPVIIFSANFNPNDTDQPGEGDGILYKPFDLEQLLRIVHLQIGQSGVKQGATDNYNSYLHFDKSNI